MKKIQLDANFHSRATQELPEDRSYDFRPSEENKIFNLIPIRLGLFCST